MKVNFYKNYRPNRIQNVLIIICQCVNCIIIVYPCLILYIQSCIITLLYLTYSVLKLYFTYYSVLLFLFPLEGKSLPSPIPPNLCTNLVYPPPPPGHIFMWSQNVIQLFNVPVCTSRVSRWETNLFDDAIWILSDIQCLPDYRYFLKS